MRRTITSLLLLGSAFAVSAQDAGASASVSADSSLSMLVLWTLVFLLGTILLLLVITLIDFGRYSRQKLMSTNTKVPGIINVFGVFEGDFRTFTGEYGDIVIEGHDYDGIQEFDNDLPPWWKYMFYVTAVFAVVYFSYYHIFDGPSQKDEYDLAVAEASIKYANVDLVYDGPETDVNLLTESKAKFVKTCKACHGELGEGKVGPNLTDAYWINGGDINSIYTTIKYGVPEKGMQSWKEQFSNEEIYQISSYIMSIQGSNPPNAKEAQGELYEEAN